MYMYHVHVPCTCTCTCTCACTCSTCCMFACQDSASLQRLRENLNELPKRPLEKSGPTKSKQVNSLSPIRWLARAEQPEERRHKCTIVIFGYVATCGYILDRPKSLSSNVGLQRPLLEILTLRAHERSPCHFLANANSKNPKKQGHAAQKHATIWHACASRITCWAA